MAAFRRGTLFVPPLMQCRHRGKINIQRPRPGPLERRVFDAITQPILLENLEDPNKDCARINRLADDVIEGEVTQLKRIYLRDVEKVFNENRLIASCQLLSITKREEFAVRNRLIKAGLRLKFMSNPNVKAVIEDSKFKNFLPLVQARSLYVICEEPKVKELVDVLKKIPQLLLLGGIVENRILTREGLLQASQLPPMDMLLGETCSLLGSHASKTHSLLSSHQQTLSSHLQQYIKDNTPSDPSS